MTCTASDGANEATCNFDIEVANYTYLDIKVFAEAITNVVDRCVTFTLFNCNTMVSAEFMLELEFAPDNGGAVAEAKLPITCGDWTSLSAKDQLHTLRRNVELQVENNRFVADFTSFDPPTFLVCGDVNDDNIVEVADFGHVLSDLVIPGLTMNPNTDCDPDSATPSPPPPPEHNDFTGDSYVDQADFQCLVTNFPRPEDGQCCQVGDEIDELCNGPSPAGSRPSRTFAIGVDELGLELGADVARALDTDGNGLFDFRDVVDVAAQYNLPLTDRIHDLARSQSGRGASR